MEQRSVTFLAPQIAEDQLAFFRWGRIAGKVLVTTDSGEWLFLDESAFTDLLAGHVNQEHPGFQQIQSKGLLRDGLDLDALAGRIARRNRHIRRGPHVHVVTLTQRSHPNGSEQQGSDDMSRTTAENVVNLALQSTATSIVFELHGHNGEPLLNFEVLKHLVDYARSRNRQGAGKTLTFGLLSNFTGMSEEAAEWLIANDIHVSTSLDGPAVIHDANRRWKGGSAHKEVVRWIDYFTRRYAELGRDPHSWCVEGLASTSRQSLGAWREVVDEYVARGLPTICLRPLQSFAFSAEVWTSIGYSGSEYLQFYQRALDYLLELNRGGKAIVERVASIFATKILSSDDSGVVDVQSPCSAGTGEVAYDFDGRIFPNDEARIVDACGDSIFELGNASSMTLSDVMRHPTVRAIAAASLLDAQPMCADCWNKPYCGFSPVYNFASGGDLFGQRPHSLECKEHMAVSARLFELLDRGDKANLEVLKRWAEMSSRLATTGRILKPAP